MVAVVEDARRLVPRTDAVLGDPRLAAAELRLGRPLVREAVRRAQQRARDGQIRPDEVAAAAVTGLPRLAASLTPVLNATGVLLHTNLGRAPLSAAAREALAAAAGCTDLEFDLPTGARGRRGAAMLAALARAVPDAQAVHVVNNNAAALVLTATVLALGREIIVSRGELIEIGDGFRLPELLESTGAKIREVGSTNRTSVADYAAAIGPRTGFVLKVHPSNYRIDGFTASAGVAELAELGVPVVGDIGSGLLAPHPALPGEPDATSWLRARAAAGVARRWRGVAVRGAGGGGARPPGGGGGVRRGRAAAGRGARRAGAGGGPRAGGSRGGEPRWLTGDAGHRDRRARRSREV